MCALRLLREQSAGKELEPLLSEVLLEELHHSRSFHDYLNSQHAAEWPLHSLFVRKSHTIKNLMAGIAKSFPEGIALPTAKLELFTFCYSEFVMHKCELPRTDYWRMLHTLHWQDEVKHVDFDLDMFQKSMFKKSLTFKVKNIFGSLLFILLLQVMSGQLCYRLLASALPERTFAARFVLMLKMFKWINLDFEPYAAARLRLKKNRTEKNLPFSRFYSFMYGTSK